MTEIILILSKHWGCPSCTTIPWPRVVLDETKTKHADASNRKPNPGYPNTCRQLSDRAIAAHCELHYTCNSVYETIKRAN